MAFMMPIVKEKYSLYNSQGPVHTHNHTSVAASARRRVRKNSDQTDGRPVPAVNQASLRRNAKSEGTSLISSSGYHPDVHHHPGTSKPMEIRRNPFSIPRFLSPQSSIRSGSGKSKGKQANSMPNGTKSPPPPVKITFSPSSRSSISSVSSSDSTSKGSSTFHTRLIKRLRKTLGLGPKEIRPTSS